MGAFTYRVFLTIINIFFPPLSTYLLCGLDMDVAINSLLFCLAVIPSHIHGFYISCTYFHRRKKVRMARAQFESLSNRVKVKKGRWPGGPKPLVYSKNVINGGASDAEVKRLWQKENGLERKTSGRSDHGSLMRSNSRRPEMVQNQRNQPGANDRAYYDGVQRQGNQLDRMRTNRSTTSNQSRIPNAQRNRTDDHMALDGYGSPQHLGSLTSRQGVPATGPMSPQSGSSRWRY